MPQLRAEQIQQSTLNNLQVAVNAAIAQSKIANHAADPAGWISKGTVTVVSDFDTPASGYQELGLSMGDGTGNSGLSINKTYHFRINGVDYSIDTTGQSAPISYNTVITLMDTAVTGDDLTVALVSGDIRVTNDNAGFDQNVVFDKYCNRHRLHDYLTGFSDFDASVSGGGVTWSAVLAGRLFYDSVNDQLRIATATDPYYQIIPMDGGWDGKITLLNGDDADNWGFPPLRYTSIENFALDGSDLFAYYNGFLLRKGSDADYTVVDTNTIEINSGYNIEDTDRITLLVYKSAPLTQYATKGWVIDYVTGDAIVDFNELLNTNSIQNGKDLAPENNGEVDLGDATHRFGTIYGQTGNYSADVQLLGGLQFGSTQQNVIYKGGSDFFIFRNYNQVYTILDVWSPSGILYGLVDGVEREATISLVRGNEPNQEFLDLYNNGYASENQFGIRIQKRGTGSYRDFVIDHYDGATKTKLFKFGADSTVTTYSNIIPSSANTIELGSPTNEFARIYTNEVLIRPLAEVNDYAKIEGEVSGNNTLVHHQIGADAGDQIIFESNNGSSISSLLTISGDGNVVIPGNLTVSGTTVYVNSENTQISDSDFVIKFANPGIDGDASISVRRAKISTEGDNDAQLKWNDTSHKWEAGIVGATNEILTRFASKTQNNFYSGTSDPTNTDRLNLDGYFYATRVYNAVYNDLAEFMSFAVESEPGEVVVMTEEGLVPSSKRADKAVVGIHSDTFGYALGAEDKEVKVPVGISGRVRVKVKERLNIGDLLISGENGFAVKATDEEAIIPGIVVGKVLQKKSSLGEERIEMLILNR